MRRTLARIAAALCAALAVFFLLPVFGGILHFGMLWPAAVLLLAAVCAAVILVTLGKMAGAAVNRPPEDAACTVIVLGCQVLPDGRPSLMLENRVRAAYDYLTAHPDAVCVASGGQNDREPDTEARCVRDTLASMGVDPARIRLEERSRSTEENLAFSAALIREEGLPSAVVIASDNFHQLRAAVWAEREGLTPYAAGCASPWFLTAGYWARETAALLYMAVTGG